MIGFIPFYLFLLTSYAAASSSSEMAPSNPPPQVPTFSLTNSVYDFAVSTFQDSNIASNNFIMSPLSVQLVLGLALSGASGQTAQVMINGLDFNGQTQDQVLNDLHELMGSLQELKGNTTLNIANKIYLSDEFHLSSTFKTDATQLYSAVETIDFTQSTAAADSINNWASQETDGNIKNVISSNNLDASTVMVLLNAIYFNGLWQHPFMPRLTRKSTFYTSLKSTQQIEMMNIRRPYNYAGYIQNLDATALQMPYTDSSMSMLFILPNKKDGLANVLSNLGKIDIGTVINPMYSTEVIVSIPKFKINTSIDLANAIQMMGMGLIFTDQADFTNMVTYVPNGQYVTITSLIQTAFIQVNELGAKAAAVTAGFPATPGEPGLPPPPPPQFIADHPFIYMILKEDYVLFMGSFVKDSNAAVTYLGSNVNSSSKLPGSSFTSSSSTSENV